VPLTAVLLIPLVGVLAFALDLGYVGMSRAELQNAADSSALAAAQQLIPYYTQYYLPGTSPLNQAMTQATVLGNAETSAKNAASTYAAFHKAGNASSVVLDTTNDVKFGYQDANTPFTSPPPSGYFPNTVEVTLRLDGGTNTNPQLSLFFANALGMGQITVTATARATIYNTDVIDFNGADKSILPATLDQQIWYNFVQTGQGSLPAFDYSAPTSTAADNLPAPALSDAPQIQVVPDPNGRPGGWNYLSLNSSSNSDSDYQTWFSSGMSSSDLTALHNGSQLPLPSQPDNPDNATYYWKGSPGDRAGSITFPAVGSVRILPLFKHVPQDQSGAGIYIASDKNSGTWDSQPGDGQNSWFNIVQFVAVVITDTSNGMSVQPAAISDPNAKLSNLQPAGPPSGASLKTFFAPPKLTY